MKFEGMESEELVKLILADANYCPCLLLGKYAVDFKKIYKDKIFSIYNLNDVREVVNNYTGIKDLGGRFFVLDGISNLSSVGQNSLLKFIEESKFPIILLSYYDKVSPIILSRTKFLFKKPINEVKNLKFVGLKEALAMVDDKKRTDPDFKQIDEVKFYAENCPKAFVGKYTASEFDYSAERILRIMSKLG